MPSCRPSLAARCLLASAVALVFSIVLPASANVAQAGRFGLPWQADVVVDSSDIHVRPDPSSAVVGSLPRGQIVPVLDQQASPDSASWYSVGNGWMRASALHERLTPWVAEVTADSVPVLARPRADSVARRSAGRGDVLRVMGLAHGIDGDPSAWWSTTEGYVPLGSIAQATGDWAAGWTLPQASEAPNGWWGAVVTQATVRAAPSVHAPALGTLAPGDRIKVLAEEPDRDDNDPVPWYRIDGGRFAGGRIYAAHVRRMPPPTPNTTPLPDGRTEDQYIVVDRTAFTLTLVRHSVPAFTTYVSIGKAGTDTPAGLDEIFSKYVADDMSSDSVPDHTGESYYLPNVPYTEYFTEDGAAIHATYWHDLFATKESHGCINLTWSDGAFLFEQTQPAVAVGSTGAQGDGTLVLIVDEPGSVSRGR
ncbi:MAG: L,D-transpeptidase family protein [Chloroflexi bacterium]|nr:L,D-transpeptidase family protein [Chloroflexota bacterium]